MLLAEDHEDSLDALRTLLEAFGFKVYAARNGHEAVELATAHAPDLVLMDMMMPHLDGLEATRILRASAAFRQVPIIAVTALEGSRERVLEAGCDDLVLKPIEVRGFVDRVRAWMAAGRRPAA
ncbi:MAG TPA: response regulator [Longimicrobiaceae bacterium]|nr:response regulator [Longimicrobiaceae bacterium]